MNSFEKPVGFSRKPEVEFGDAALFDYIQEAPQQGLDQQPLRRDLEMGLPESKMLEVASAVSSNLYSGSSGSVYSSESH